jgi:hypothetical protein
MSKVWCRVIMKISYTVLRYDGTLLIVAFSTFTTPYIFQLRHEVQLLKMQMCLIMGIIVQASKKQKHHWLLFLSWEIVSIVPWRLIEEVETIILWGCFTV